MFRLLGGLSLLRLSSAVTRLMYDAVNWRAIPADAAMVAGYDWTSRYAWPAEAWARFPRAVKVRISVTDRGDGDVLDVETTDATPSQAPAWVLKRRATGADPTVYMNYSTWGPVVQAFHVQGVAEPHYWVAYYNGVRDIPGTAVAHQYIDPPGSGGDFDLSVVLDHWPGVDGPPAPPVSRKVPDPVWFNKMSNGSIYETNGLHFVWVNGQPQLDARKYAIAATGANVFQGDVSSWQQMGIPVDQRSAQAASASDAGNPCPWPPLAG